jgi:hypothetical protein
MSLTRYFQFMTFPACCGVLCYYDFPNGVNFDDKVHPKMFASRLHDYLTQADEQDVWWAVVTLWLSGPQMKTWRPIVEANGFRLVEECTCENPNTGNELFYFVKNLDGWYD